MHPEALAIASDTARAAGLSSDRIVVFDVKGVTTAEMLENHESVSSLVEFGLRNKVQYADRVLAPGEAKTKLAFLSFSSGTTGRPKVGLWNCL